VSDDYSAVITNLELARDTIALDLGAAAAALAALSVVPNFAESGDGGTETIDVPGQRRQLVEEISEKGRQIRELSVTIASLQAGLSSTRLRVNGNHRCLRSF